MFLLQLQLYVLTIIRVTLLRIQKPFRWKSTFCKFKHTILSKLRVQRKSVLQALYIDCSEWAIHWSIVVARIDFVSLYFRLLWYHRGSIDQNHAKTNEIWRQNSEIHSVLLVPVGLHDFQIFPDRMREAWKRETYVRSQSSSSESAVKYLLSGEQRFKYPLPWENKVSQMPHPRANKDNQIPAPCPSSPPPRRHDIDRCIKRGC